MSGEHRIAKLAFPDAPPGTCQYCGKKIPGGRLRMHPSCRELFSDQKNYRQATIRKAGPMKHCALAYLGGCSPYNARTAEGLEADHGQRLVDRGRKEKARLLCVEHHSHKTRAENRKDRQMARQRREVQEDHRSGVNRFYVGLTVQALIAGWAWHQRHLNLIALILVVELVLLTLVLTLTLTRRARATRRRNLVIKLADYLNIADIRPKTLRRVTWDKAKAPIAGEIEYGLEFDDREGSPDRAKTESYITQLTGRTTGFEWVTHENRLHWFPTDQVKTEVVEPTKVETAGERLQARIADSVASALATKEGERAECATEVVVWEGDHPVQLSIAYPATSAVKVATSEVEIVDAISAVEMPQGEWHTKVDRRGGVIVVRDRPDPLDMLVPHGPIELELDLLTGPVIGIDQDHQPHREPAMAKSCLLAGESGSGKASVQWGVLRGVAPLIRQGLVRLWVVNPKPEEFASLERGAYRYADTAEEITELLEDARIALGLDQQRMKANFVRKVDKPTREHPCNFLLLDELAMVTAYELDNTRKKKNVGNISALATQARSAGWYMLAAVQDPRADVVKMRPIFNRQIGLRLADADATRQILGSGARAQGALCDRIRQDRPGTGYVVDEKTFSGFKRFRTAYTSDDEVLRIADYLAGKIDVLDGVPA